MDKKGKGERPSLTTIDIRGTLFSSNFVKFSPRGGGGAEIGEIEFQTLRIEGERNKKGANLLKCLLV